MPFIIGLFFFVFNHIMMYNFVNVFCDMERKGIDMRKILVVIDMQNDFIDGVLGTKEAYAILPEVVKKIKEYPPEDVFVTRDTHEHNYLDTTEGKHLPVKHCIYGTDGWQLAPEIKQVLSGAEIIDKPTFGSTSLAEMLKLLSQDEKIEIEICGVCTDICVIANAILLKTYMPEVEITLDSACCAGSTPKKHVEALSVMQSCHINII